MKKEIKGFVLGVLSTVVVGSGVALAAGQLTSIDIYPNNVTIALRGQVTDIPSFTYNDRTYVELRRVLEGIDCEVEYDANAKVVNAYNSYVLMRPAYINQTGKAYDLVTWTATPYSTDVRGYIDINALLDLGFSYVPDSVDEYGMYVYSAY